jgi:hypothetical protein
MSETGQRAKKKQAALYGINSEGIKGTMFPYIESLYHLHNKSNLSVIMLDFLFLVEMVSIRCATKLPGPDRSNLKFG